MELVDMTDSKSVASDSVAVQVRPLVPSLLFEVDTKTGLYPINGGSAFTLHD